MESYIIRNNEEIYVIYRDKGTIRIRKRLEDKWGEAKIIANATKGSFSLMSNPEGVPIVIYQDSMGNIMLADRDKPHKMVLRNTNTAPMALHITGIIRNGSIQLFYNRDFIGESYITEQHRREDGSWSKAAAVDKYISDRGLTKLINIGNNYVLFYSKKVPEQQIGYREISRYGTGNFKMLYSTGYKITDYSVAATQDEIHMCAIVATNRYSRLIYTVKNSGGISEAKTLYEGVIKNCYIYIENSKINIIFKNIGGNCKIVSDNMGKTFRRIENIEPFNFNKAPFADYTNQSADTFAASELLTDCALPYEVRHCSFISSSLNEVERLKKEIERLKRVAKP